MTNVRKITLVRKLLSSALLVCGCLCLFFLDRVDIVMNASKSLEAPAFLMLEHPVLLRRGAVISTNMPAPLRSKFEGLHYVKVIRGLPGERITMNGDGDPCIEDNECFPLLYAEGKAIAPSVRPGVIPEDHYAVFGSSADSVDSRYAAIGLIHRNAIIGRGVAVSWMPDWRDQ
mgnify:CR=1 FL=1